MKVNQIATILNEVFDEITGESAVVQEDLSNVVDVGRTIISSTEWGNNFENYVKKIIDKVGKSIFRDRVLSSSAPPIMRDAWSYGSVLEKIRCDVPDYTENKEWDLANYQPDVFSFTAPSVEVKYFNLKTTFQTKISIARKQVESAFRSADGVNRFFSMIENRIRMKMTMAADSLVYRTIANLIVEKTKANVNVVNLLTEYNTLAGTELTAATALVNKDFLRYAAKTVMMYKEFVSRPSMLYNNEGYVTFTPAEDLIAIFLSDFAKALETSLYADTFNAEFVKLDGYTEIPYWQGSGNDNSYTERSKIIALPASNGGTGAAQTVNNIVAVMFDRDAAMVCNEEPDVRSIYNPEGNFYNFWHTFDSSYFNDVSENCVVFTLN